MNFDFLKQMVSVPTPTGFENEFGGQEMWCKFMEAYSEKTEIDSYGNAYAYLNSGNEKTLLLDAHVDEISWMVNYITDDGFIRVIRNGGSDHQTAPATKVKIWTDSGDAVDGVFGHPAIHIKDRGEPDIKKLFVDIGVSSKDAVIEKGINIGSVITMTEEFNVMGDFVTGHALDDKAGGYVNYLVAQKLKGKELGFNVVVVNSVQEEIGLRGAEMAASYINPDMVICVDVCHDVTPPCYDASTEGDVKSGKGPVILKAPSIHNGVLKTLKSVGVDYQLLARSTYSGTNTDSYAYRGKGIPSALVSIPMRYMHTQVEMIHKDDIEKSVELILGFISKVEI